MVFTYWFKNWIKAYLRNNRKSFRTLQILPKSPPLVDGGKEKGAGNDVKSLPAAYNGMSNINCHLAAIYSVWNLQI